VIDPADRHGSVAVLRQAVRRDRTLLIYPEGRRSDDGQLQRFHPAGLLAMLEERREPVWLVATDGFSAGRRVVDFVMNVHRIDGRTELVGRYDPPTLAEDLPAFVARLHADLGAHLVTMRARGEGPAASPAHRALPRRRPPTPPRPDRDPYRRTPKSSAEIHGVQAERRDPIVTPDPLALAGAPTVAPAVRRSDRIEKSRSARCSRNESP
jgi:hypothetical protein